MTPSNLTEQYAPYHTESVPVTHHKNHNIRHFFSHCCGFGSETSCTGYGIPDAGFFSTVGTV